MITTKTYICGLCQTESEQSTNHKGEIYVNCKTCGNGVLYCKETYETTKWNLTCNVYSYNFDISKTSELNAYDKLCNKLKAKGFKRFNVYANYETLKRIEKHSSVSIDTSYIFDNQWKTSIGRLHNWFEGVFPNSNVKKGYWLEVTSEMLSLQSEIYACGYCGKQTQGKESDFCNNCLGSEYLTENELPLLFLVKVSEKDKFNRKTVVIPENVLTEYKARQRKRLLAKTEKELERIKNEAKQSEKKYQAYKLLAENSINFDNVIYYTHTDTFCFGWRKSLSEMEIKQLNKTLFDIGFQPKYKVSFNK